jgi:hypothetical protein
MEFTNSHGQAPDAPFFSQEIKKRFPFANLSGDYAAPEWVKPLLFQKYSLKDIGNCIRFLNKLKLHAFQIPPEIIEDVEIERYEDYEIDVCVRKWRKENKVLANIEIIDQNGDIVDNFQVPKDLKIRNFKSFILNTRYKKN